MADIYVVDDSPTATTAWAAFKASLLTVVEAGTATEAELVAVRLDMLRAVKSISFLIADARKYDDAN